MTLAKGCFMSVPHLQLLNHTKWENSSFRREDAVTTWQHSTRIFPQKQMKQKQGSENVSLADKRALDSQRIRRVPQGRIKVLRPFASTSESNGVSAGFPI